MPKSGIGSPRLPAAAAALAVMALALSACGGGDSNSSSPQSGQPNRAAFAKFQACLKDHGVNFPQGRPGGGGAPPNGTPPNGTPPTGTVPNGPPPTNGQTAPRPPDGAAPPGFNSKKFQAAMQACAKYRPQGAGGFPGGGPPPGQPGSGGSS